MDRLFRSHGLVAALGFVVFSTFGCAAQTGSDSDVAELGQATQADQVEVVSDRLESASDDKITPQIIRIRKIDAVGTGCPNANSYMVDISPDKQAFTVRFTQYNTEIDRGESFKRIGCTLGIHLDVTQGYTYAVTTIDYAGYVFLSEPGMRAKQSAAYFFQGDRVLQARAGDSVWANQTDRPFVLRDTVAFSTVVWSRCNETRNLYVDSSMQLNNNRSRSGDGYIETTDVNGEIRYTFHIQWKRC